MIRRPPRSTLSSSSAASDVYKRQANQGTNGHVVEADVVSTRSTQRQTVVVNDLDTVRFGEAFNDGTSGGVNRVNDQDLGTLGDVGLGHVELRCLAALSILHDVLLARQTSGLEGLDQVRSVKLRVAR